MGRGRARRQRPVRPTGGPADAGAGSLDRRPDRGPGTGLAPDLRRLADTVLPGCRGAPAGPGISARALAAAVQMVSGPSAGVASDPWHRAPRSAADRAAPGAHAAGADPAAGRRTAAYRAGSHARRDGLLPSDPQRPRPARHHPRLVLADLRPASIPRVFRVRAPRGRPSPSASPCTGSRLRLLLAVVDDCRIL